MQIKVWVKVKPGPDCMFLRVHAETKCSVTGSQTDVAIQTDRLGGVPGAHGGVLQYLFWECSNTLLYGV